MLIRSSKFTPEVLLSAPRRGAALPNHDGKLALYTVSSYSFETKEETKEIRILDIDSGNSTLFSNDPEAHDARWLGDGTNAIIWLQSGVNGITSIMIGDGDKPAEASYTSDVILAPFENLKTARLEDGSIAIAMTGLATEDGSLYNKETAEKSPSTGRLYDKTFVRFWDSYMIKQRNVIWYSKLENFDGRYSLAAPVHNALKGTQFECPFPDPTGDMGGAFDLGPTGLAFIALDPDSNPAIKNFVTQAYFVPLRDFTEPKVGRFRITSPLTGAFSTVKLSPDGSKAALIQSVNQENGADGRLMLADLNSHSANAEEMFKGKDGSSVWDLNPSGIEWSRDGRALYITAEDCGRTCLFSTHPFDYEIFDIIYPLPKKLSLNGSVTGNYPLDNESAKILVSSNSYVENGVYQIIDAADPLQAVIVNSSSKNGLKFGLSHEQVSEMYFEGAGDYCVQAWVVKPSDFHEDRKYPLALIIHGGPQSAWSDAWSTRWNPCVWAEQGYVVVAPNITGSTGFGRDFLNGIQGEWGGRPYYDLENCFEYVSKHLPFVDTDRAIAAGASYGGYMMNWIQGMPLGRKFKAIVCHDGIFNLHSMIASDVVDGGTDFNGSLWPWENFENLEKYSPSQPDLCKNWATPMLVIHSSQDFRCILSDGIAAFHICQKLEIPSQFLNFPDEGHWVLKHENSLLWHKTVFNFINKYSGITKTTTTASAAVSVVEEVRPNQSQLIHPPVKGLPELSDSWTKESDLKLLIARAKGMSWEEISKELSELDASPSQCEDRYKTQLIYTPVKGIPGLRDSWTKESDHKLLIARASFRMSWEEISKKLSMDMDPIACELRYEKLTRRF